MDSEKEKCINLDKEEYGDTYARFSWPSREQAAEGEKKRAALIDALESFNEFHKDFKNSKPYSRKLSPGCRCCGEGTWSCLFINNICNAHCMYCPTEQSQTDEPTTNSLRFPQYREYIDYLNRFGFKGASISGGEPLLTFDRTLLFLTEIKKRFGDNIYLWLYTNGILLDIEKIIRLKYTGLDEIRFNLGAVNYKPDQVKLAAGKIPHLTVEIPVVPDEPDTLKAMMIRLADLGVEFLNLHQLRCTPYNSSKLLERNYTFLHGKKVTVMDSELAALELLKFGLEKELPLAVNYCSFVYKNRFQSLAPRRRFGQSMLKPYEDMTDSGYIRSLSVKAATAEADRLAERFKLVQGLESSWLADNAKNRVFFNRSLMESAAAEGFPLLLGYDEAFIRPFPSFRYPYLEISLDSGRKLTVERRPVLIDYELPPNASFPGSSMDLFEFEHTPEGLAEYY